jgi:3-keto-5-aminohexanoate cleavage enzyme
MSQTPVIIEAAINGGTTKARNPHVPLSPDEISKDSLACIEAGAAIIHSHLESFELNGKAAAERYLQGWRSTIRARPDAIFYATGATGDTIEERCAHTEALAESGAMRMGFIDPGSTNFGTFRDDGMPGKINTIYANPFPEIEYSFGVLERGKLGPAIAIYEPNFLRSTLMYHRAGRLPRGAFVKFYMSGEYNFLDGKKGQQFWGLPPTRKGLDAYIEMLGDSGLPWAVAVMGGDLIETGMAQMALERGGHIRLGLEDYASERTPSNVELIQEVVAVAKKVGRPIADPETAAKMLDLPRKSASVS